MKNSTIMNCRVCGLIQSSPPWGEDGTCPNYEFCDCCGCEFGYDDMFFDDILDKRKKWLSNPNEWNKPSKKPMNWDISLQLENIICDL